MVTSIKTSKGNYDFFGYPDGIHEVFDADNNSGFVADYTGNTQDESALAKFCSDHNMGSYQGINYSI